MANLPLQSTRHQKWDKQKHNLKSLASQTKMVAAKALEKKFLLILCMKANLKMTNDMGLEGSFMHHFIISVNGKMIGSMAEVNSMISPATSKKESGLKIITWAKMAKEMTGAIIKRKTVRLKTKSMRRKKAQQRTLMLQKPRNELELKYNYYNYFLKFIFSF